MVCDASLNSPFPFGSLLFHNLGKRTLTWANECTKNVQNPVKLNIPTDQIVADILPKCKKPLFTDSLPTASECFGIKHLNAPLR